MQGGGSLLAPDPSESDQEILGVRQRKRLHAAEVDGLREGLEADQGHIAGHVDVERGHGSALEWLGKELPIRVRDVDEDGLTPAERQRGR